MEEITARASLVPAAAVGQGLTTTVSRSEIEDVLETGEAPIELVLEITRSLDGEAGETHNVAVSWERTDLENLLREAQGDEVILTFDREALRHAVESDVEGHGIREAALALAVAATAATGAAGTAAADPGQLGMRGVSAQSTISSPDDRSVSRATPTAAEASVGVDDRAVPRATPIPDPVLGVDDRAMPRATPTPDPVLGVDDRAVPRATPTVAPTTAPDPVLGVDDRAVPRATPVVTPATGAVSDPGISWAPSPAETAALAGAIAIAITGAFFIVGGRRRFRPGSA